MSADCVSQHGGGVVSDVAACSIHELIKEKSAPTMSSTVKRRQLVILRCSVNCPTIILIIINLNLSPGFQLIPPPQKILVPPPRRSWTLGALVVLSGAPGQTPGRASGGCEPDLALLRLRTLTD